jgi:membrane-anchored glycerophosphoryl diester phosphodiesterase (GDPDase)
MLTEERRAQFKDDVARQKLKTDQGRHDGAVRVAGVLMMLIGVIGAFIAYNNSLAQDDLRNIGSFQVLATAFAALTVLGAALYLAAALSRVLRLWLLRQLVESQDRADQIAAALESRKP